MHADPTQTVVAKLRELPPERLREVEDFIDFLRSRAKRPARAKSPSRPLWDFPVDQVGPWPKDLSLRREDLYGDDGR